MPGMQGGAYMCCSLRVSHQSFEFLNKPTKIGPYFYVRYSSKILENINYKSIKNKILKKMNLLERRKNPVLRVSGHSRKGSFPPCYDNG